MASASSDSEGQAPASHGPRECMACRGSGSVISNLGGTPTSLTCPWCGGGGMRIAGIDAQARWQAADAGAAPSAGAEADAAGSSSEPAS